MQLRNDDPLGSIDDKRTSCRHQRDLAHIQRLVFLYLFDGAGVPIQKDQANASAQGTGKSQAALLTFFDVESRLTQHKIDELEAGVP